MIVCKQIYYIAATVVSYADIDGKIGHFNFIYFRVNFTFKDTKHSIYFLQLFGFFKLLVGF